MVVVHASCRQFLSAWIWNDWTPAMKCFWKKIGASYRSGTFLSIWLIDNGSPDRSRPSPPPCLGVKPFFLKLSSSLIRSCFKIVYQVQDQGGTDCSTAGIYEIFRGLNDLSQHRDWALDAILKQLLRWALGYTVMAVLKPAPIASTMREGSWQSPMA